MAKRTIIFGDIHGCYEEWQDLIDKIKPAMTDRLVAVGDLICKGPSSTKTLDMAVKMKNLTCLMGNHEYHFLCAWKENRLNELTKDYQLKTLQEMSKKIDFYMKFIETWPYYLELPECIVIHAGLRPGIPLEQQKYHDLVFLRTIESNNDPWYEHYHGKKLVVHGHWAREGLVIRDNVISLDTGCVYGKELTAVILPSRQIVSVRAQQSYSPIT